jgi:hypothetical protein
MKLAEFIRALGFAIPAYQRPLVKALQCGEAIRATTDGERRRAQKAAHRYAMAEFQKFLNR